MPLRRTAVTTRALARIAICWRDARCKCGRGDGEAVTDSPRADSLAKWEGIATYFEGCWVFGEPDVSINAEDLYGQVSELIKCSSDSLVHFCGLDALLWTRRGLQLTMSLTGSSGTVSSISTSRSVRAAAIENQSRSACLKSGSCTAFFRVSLLQCQGSRRSV
jgi:hypothetical protein